MYSIRAFEPADTENIWNLHATALTGEKANVGDDFFADLRDISKEFLAAGGDFLLGFASDELVSCGGFVPRSTSEVEIKRMRVHPDHRRRGHGQALLTALETSAASRGYESAYLETTVDQAAARALYEKHGFEEIGWTEKHGFEVVLMRKGLG